MARPSIIPRCVRTLAALAAVAACPCRASALVGPGAPHWPFRDSAGLPSLLATDRAEPRETATIDLMVGYATRSTGRHELVGGLVLALPFDRAVASEPPPTGSPHPRAADPVETGPPPKLHAPPAPITGRSRPQAARAPADRPTGATRGAPAGRGPVDPAHDGADASEPCDDPVTAAGPPTGRASSGAHDWAPPRIAARDLRAATAAALRNASLSSHLEALDDLANRARWSAALPELRLRATRLVDESESVAPTEYDAGRTTATGSASLWLEARGTWHLERAVFADEEVRVARMRLDLAREHERLRARVVELLFDWQRATIALRRDATDPVACWDAWLVVEQLAAELDWLTGGWFDDWSRRRGWRAGSAPCAPP